MAIQNLMHVQTNRQGIVNRRSFVKSVGAGAAALGMLGWKDALTLQADELRRQGKAVILLFMQGGPSQFETFDPKPGTRTGGPTEAINTAVNGIRIAQGWTNVAREMEHISIIRSMNNREGAHPRAVYQMHTGYVPAGGVRYPTLGSIVSSEIAPQEFDLPHFVSVGAVRLASLGAGFLDNTFAPFVVNDPDRMPNNAELPSGINNNRFNRRLSLMQDLEQDFASSGGATRVRQHRNLYDGAAQMVQSPRLRAFDLSQERDAVRDRYGRTSFGQGCLLARRLVESGVTFVEVVSRNWDTHADNFNRTGQLVQQVDPGFGSLIRDLRERGMLDRTLVIWMGEFGRTPRINARTGRDHYPRAFNMALAGCGIRGGRVVGSTNDSGTTIANRPVSVPDLFCTFCHALDINPRKENITPIGRPIRIVDGGNHVRELF